MILSTILLFQALSFNSFADSQVIQTALEDHWVERELHDQVVGKGSMSLRAVDANQLKSTAEAPCSFIQASPDYLAIGYSMRHVPRNLRSNDLGVRLPRVRVGRAYANLIPILFDARVPVEVRNRPLEVELRYCTDEAGVALSCESPWKRAEKVLSVGLELIKITKTELNAEQEVTAVTSVSCSPN